MVFARQRSYGFLLIKSWENENQSSRLCLLYDRTVRRIPFRILCFIRNLRYTESRFILTGFTWTPQIDNWIRHQLFNLQLSPYHVHGTHTYTFTYIDTQDAMEKTLSKDENHAGGCPYLLQGHPPHGFHPLIMFFHGILCFNIIECICMCTMHMVRR